jgi:hypothetical protein
MGRRIRWTYYYFKRLLLFAALGWVLFYAISYLGLHYDEEVEARSKNVMLPQIVEVDLKGVEPFLKEPRVTTLIFIYSTRSLLCRWYFDDFNKIAAKYAPKGVRILYISVDSDVKNLADYLSTRGDIYFTPLHMSGRDAELYPDMIGQLGGDPFGGALPYMGIMNASLHLRDFPQGLLRTGKIEEVLDEALRGG